MRKTLMMSAACLGLALCAPAFAPIAHAETTPSSQDASASGHWAHQPGTGMSGPASVTAANIDHADTASPIAPHLPSPKLGEGASADDYIRAAMMSLERKHTGAAQQSLEMAETRLLDRSTPATSADMPDQDVRVQHVNAALQALGHKDGPTAMAAMHAALLVGPGSPGMRDGGMGMGTGNMGPGSSTGAMPNRTMGGGTPATGSTGM